MIQSLKAYIEKEGVEGVFIEIEADFAPFQPNGVGHASVRGVPLYQFANYHDNVANNPWLSGSKNQMITGATHYEEDDDPKKGHSIFDFTDKINALPAGRYKIVNWEIVPENWWLWYKQKW